MEPAPQVIKSTNSYLRAEIIILTVVLLVVGGFVGYFSRELLFKNSPLSKTSAITPPSEAVAKGQSSTIEAMVTSNEGDALILRDSDGKRIDVKASPNLRVYIEDPKTQSSIVTDASSLELNKKAIITLAVIDNRYTATSIIYQATPSAPPSNN